MDCAIVVEKRQKWGLKVPDLYLGTTVVTVILHVLGVIASIGIALWINLFFPTAEVKEVAVIFFGIGLGLTAVYSLVSHVYFTLEFLRSGALISYSWFALGEVVYTIPMLLAASVYASAYGSHQLAGWQWWVPVFDLILMVVSYCIIINKVETSGDDMEM